MSSDSSTEGSSVSPLASEWPKLERATRLADKWNKEVTAVVANMAMKRGAAKEKKKRKKNKKGKKEEAEGD